MLNKRKFEFLLKFTYGENEGARFGVQVCPIPKPLHFTTMSFRRWKHPILGDQERFHEAGSM
jgi:hypothetical protein